MPALSFITSPSPNWDERSQPIDMIVLHYTGMKSGEEALARLRSEEAKVSSHYLIMQNGDIHHLVDEEKRAWHAGVSSWHGNNETNARSIGIEIVNPGHEWGYCNFPEQQMQSVVALVKDIVDRRSISPALVIGHSDVAPARKEDPGERFDWGRLAREKLALAPFSEREVDVDSLTLDYFGALDGLRKIGYDVPVGGHGAAVLAFQRHFCPQDLGHALSPLTRIAIENILGQIQELSI